MKNLLTLHYTVKYLKWTQIRYRLFYLVRNKLGSNQARQIGDYRGRIDFEFQSFSFLTRQKIFEGRIDWNFADYGKLWTYNLNYFEFIHRLDETNGKGLVYDYCSNYSELRDGLEPYPTSLRLINLVKWSRANHIQFPELSKLIAEDASRLNKNLEYHLLGNHLLENGYGLLFASVYLNDKVLLSKAEALIRQELIAEYHDDGGHFEQSPMYHLILLERILDSIELLKPTEASSTFLEFLLENARKQLAFASFICVGDDFPQFNDAAFGIAKTPSYLFNKAEDLGLEWDSLNQGKNSGFLKFVNGNFLSCWDTKSIGPDYQPGHAHADTFTFCLYYKGRPIIVDTGTSTYEIGERRDIERSTLAHNTVAYNGENSSEVWGGFRVARRAKTDVELSDFGWEGSHDGYRSRFGVQHVRSVEQTNKGVIIKDEMTGSVKVSSISSLHFHPDCTITSTEEGIVVNGMVLLRFRGFDNTRIIDYKYAPEFNKLIVAKKWEGEFLLSSSIQIEETHEN